MFGFSYSTPACIPDYPSLDTMTRRSKPSNASDPIEQYTATQPITARATPSKSSPRDRVSRRLQVPLLRLHECLRALNPTLLRAGRPSSNVDPMTTTQHSEHSRRQPSGQPPGAWGSVVYEHSSRPPPLAIWLRQVTGENVDSEGLPRPMTSSTAVEEAHERHLVERVADYIRYISHDKLSTVRAKSLDCTFCGLLFPPYYLLAVNPDNVDDWRNCHYRCCYQCATGQREDFVWYSEFSSWSPAILGQRGSLRNELYDNLDRSQTIDRDEDPDDKPAGWHVAIERDNDWCPKVYFGSFWDTARCRWVRKPVFRSGP